MGWKNLLVQIDGGRADDKRIDVAIGLAQRFEAHLSGLFVSGDPMIPGFALAQMPAGIREERFAQQRKHAQTAADAFCARLARAGLPADCRIDRAIDSDVPRVVSRHARHADMIILGQPDPDAPPVGGAGLIGDVALDCGRPVLAVPYIGPRPGLGDRVLVAWDGGREAARAVNDALPLLRRARKVLVVVVNAADRPDRHGDVAGADIALHLSRHGVVTEVTTLVAQDLEVGDMLLSRVSDEGADLMVMGAYGHPRLRESLFGGVTRTILRTMTVPVLMSH